MFGKQELVKRIEAIEEENKRLFFIIENPPKYIVGQKIGKQMVTHVFTVPITIHTYGFSGNKYPHIIGYQWKYEFE